MSGNVAFSATLADGGVKVYSKEFVWLALIALYCVNTNLSVFIPFLFLPLVFMSLVKDKHNVAILALIAFGLSYGICVYLYDFVTNVKVVLMYALYPICFYIVGSHLVKGDAHYRKTTRVLMTSIVSLVMFGFLSLFKTLSVYGDIDALTTATYGRVVLNYWNSSLIAATGLNTYLSVGLSLLFVLFLSSKGASASKGIKFICLTSFVLSVYGVITLGNRTGVLIAVASILMIYLFAEKFDTKKLIKLAVFLILIFVLKLFYEIDVFGVKQSFEDTLLYSRFHETDASRDPRFAAWGASFRGIFEHPMGGRETILPLRYAHNMWLDVGYTAGVVPFALLLLFTGYSLKLLINFVKSSSPSLIKGIMLGLYTAFFITFFFEPIMEGWFSYFAVFCLIVGMLHRINVER